MLFRVRYLLIHQIRLEKHAWKIFEEPEGNVCCPRAHSKPNGYPRESFLPAAMPAKANTKHKAMSPMSIANVAKKDPVKS